MVLLSFGGRPEADENPAFARWWQSLPPEFKVAKGDARREWYKLKPSPALAQRMIEAVQAQSQTRKWKAGYFTTPAKWIKGERWDDYVEPDTVSSAERSFTERELREAHEWYRRVGIGLDRTVPADEHIANFIRHRLRLE